ncbi:hypothetical protein MBLNU13_g05257t1 [Cladosporium sp. NU13]
MVEKNIPGLSGTFVFPDSPSTSRTRPSLFPTREQVASLRGLPLPPPRIVPQPPEPDLTTTAQEAGPDADAAESIDVDMTDAPSPLEYTPVDADNEPSHLPAITPPQHSSSFRTPTVPRPEGYKTPPRGPSFSPITPPAHLATENSGFGQYVSSLELPPPAAAAYPRRSTSARPSSAFRAPIVPRSEDYETPPHVQSLSSFSSFAQPSAEINDAGRNSSSDGHAGSVAGDESIAPHATQEDHTVENDNGDHSEREVWDAAPAQPPQQLIRIGRRAHRAQGRSPGTFRILYLPDKAIHQILDILLVYEDPIALVRKSPDRRIIEAQKSHIVTVGQGKITREPQDKKLKSNVARTVNTASPTNLFLVCRGLRDLGIKTYYNKNTFAFSNEQGMAGWAKSIGSRRKEVRKVELRSEWEVAFENNDIHSKDLSISGTGVLDTRVIRVLRNIERVDVDLALRMPWQRTGKLPGDYDKVLLDAQRMCFEYGKEIVKAVADRFRLYELNTPLIEKHQHVWFDKSWVEPWYESIEFKRRDAEWKFECAAKRAAEREARESTVD